MFHLLDESFCLQRSGKIASLLLTPRAQFYSPASPENRSHLPLRFHLLHRVLPFPVVHVEDRSSVSALWNKVSTSSSSVCIQRRSDSSSIISIASKILLIVNESGIVAIHI